MQVKLQHSTYIRKTYKTLNEKIMIDMGIEPRTVHVESQHANHQATHQGHNVDS